MDKAGTIDTQPWMTANETVDVLEALGRDGGTARFVGGCVRDAILGRAVHDIDIATETPPETVMNRLRSANIKAVPTGIDHGTITAVTPERHFEITTLRHDVETFGRHARVAFIDDWAADAERRDFTMNALFCDRDGTLYDPTGGLDDIRAGRVRFVGEATARITEDVLRLLRFFRFHAWYGRGAPDADALTACRAMADKLPTLSAERVWAELRRILLAPDPAAALDLMADNGVLDHVLPEARSRPRLARLSAIETRLGLDADAILRLIAVIAIDGKAAPDLARRLRMSNKENARVAANLDQAEAVAPGLDDRASRRALYALGADLFRDRVLIGWAEDDDDDAWPDAWRASAAWRRPVFPLKGADAIALGIPKGPAIGGALSRVEDWWIDADFRPDRAACLARLAAEATR